MKKYIPLLLSFLFLGNSALAQIGKSIEECERVLGQPMKIHANQTPPARLYLYKGIAVQLSYDTGRAVAAVYRIQNPNSQPWQELQNIPFSKGQLDTIYFLNGISSGGLRVWDSRFPQHLVTSDDKKVFYRDTRQNVVVVYDMSNFLRELKGMGVPISSGRVR